VFWRSALFDSDLSKWEVSSVNDMHGMFWSATSFNGDLSTWDVSSVQNMYGTFRGATSFNGDISKWDVSSVKDMHGMFLSATSFNSDLSKWDVSSARGMYGMFWSAASFNSDLSKWDVSSVMDMYGTFRGATTFNSDLSKWDVSKVTDMHGMFMSAASFNGGLSKWDVSRVTNMDYMFKDAISFKQALCGAAWVHSRASKIDIFAGSLGSISRTVCTSVTAMTTTFTRREYASRRSIPERELIVRTLITTITSANTMACPKCGKFKKSDRVSCCAPGGAWFDNCGGAGNRNVEHRWFEGVEACKPRTTTIISSECPKCGNMEKSGKISCCGRGGSWFGNCASAGNTKLDHTWHEGVQACKAPSQFKTIVG